MNLIGKVININSELSREEIDTLLKHWQVFPVEVQNNALAPLEIIVIDRIDGNSAHLQTAIKRKLKSFLKQNYPTKARLLLDCIAENEGFQSEASIDRLFEYLKGSPTLILESEIEENSLSLNMVYWGANDEEYNYTKILDNYRTDSLKNSEYFADFILNYRCLIAGWTIDYHHLKDSGKSPVLPRLLPKLIKNIDLEAEQETLVESLVNGYDLIYNNLAAKLPKLIPQLYLELAESLIRLNKIGLSKKLVKSSITTWLQSNQSDNFVARDILEKMLDRFSNSDEKYIQKLNRIYLLLNEPEKAKSLQKYLHQVKADREFSYWKKSMLQMPIFQGKIC